MGISLDTKTNTWVAYYSKRHPTTKVPKSLKRIGIKSKVEAQRVFNSLVIQLDNSFKSQIQPKWKDLLEKYFDSLKTSGLTNTTVYNRETLLRLHTIPHWQDKLVSEIGTQEIHHLLNTRLCKNAESHKKFFLKCIRSVFHFALEQRFVNRNPTPVIRFKLNDKIRSVLNEEQITLLLRKAQEYNWKWYPHYATAIFTGLRSGELYALRWNNVNLDKRQILVNCSWSNKDGFKSTKSGHDRIVEIPMPLLPLLKELKLQSADCEFVLPRLDRWDRGEQAHDLRLFLKSIGLHEIRFHDLRASWATLLLSKGVAPSKVMSQGGWKNMDTMMIYMRKAGIDIKDSTNVLDNMQTHGIESGKLIQMKVGL